MKKIRLISTDIDGTLVNSKKELTERTKKILFKAMDEGVVLVLNTGRPECGVRTLVKELELDKRGGYVSAYNGGKVVDCITGEVVVANPVPEEYLPSIFEAARKYKMPLLTHKGAVVITENPEDEYVIAEADINDIPVMGIKCFEEFVDFPTYKYIATASPDEMPALEKKMFDELSDRLDVFTSCPFFLEVVAKNTSKGRAIKELADKLGFTLEECIAFGDAPNDISMIEMAGTGVAMGNAEESVKLAADRIALSNDEDGLAAVLEELI